MQTTRDFHYESLHKREVFWAREAARIHWHRPFDRVVDVSRLPLARWFPGGQTNLCHNAVDRWAEAMPTLKEPVKRFADLFCRLRYGAPLAKEERAAAQSEMKKRLQLIRHLRREGARG